MFTLRFSSKFDAPVGATIQYLGMARWQYVEPTANVTVTFSHHEGNSYALDTGGMKGTTWIVVLVVEEESSKYGEYMVTLNPNEA